MSAFSVLHCNAQAVAAMREGKYAESNQLLQGALRELNCIQQSQELPKQNGVLSLESLSLCIGSVPIKGVSTDSFDTTVFSFFNRALVFTQDTNSKARSSSNNDQSSCSKVALVVLYNLGLSLQLLAARTGYSGYLHSAREFFKHAMALASLASESMESMDLLAVLALVNNMGCVSAALVDYDGASGCLSMLTSLYDTADVSSLLTEEEYTFFYTTIFVFPDWQLAAAPTA